MTPHEEYVAREKAAKEWRALVLPKMLAIPFPKIGTEEPDKVATGIYFNLRHERRTR